MERSYEYDILGEVRRILLEEQIESVTCRFKSVCAQLRLLNRQIVETERRYVAADRDGNEDFRYCIGLRLKVFVGVRDMHHLYAVRMADRLDQLRTKAGFNIIGAHPENWQDDLSDLYLI